MAPLPDRAQEHVFARRETAAGAQSPEVAAPIRLKNHHLIRVIIPDTVRRKYEVATLEELEQRVKQLEELVGLNNRSCVVDREHTWRRLAEREESAKSIKEAVFIIETKTETLASAIKDKLGQADQ